MKTLISHILGKNFIFLIAELSFLIFFSVWPSWQGVSIRMLCVASDRKTQV